MNIKDLELRIKMLEDMINFIHKVQWGILAAIVTDIIIKLGR